MWGLIPGRSASMTLPWLTQLLVLAAQRVESKSIRNDVDSVTDVGMYLYTFINSFSYPV